MRKNFQKEMVWSDILELMLTSDPFHAQSVGEFIFLFSSYTLGPLFRYFRNQESYKARDLFLRNLMKLIKRGSPSMISKSSLSTSSDSKFNTYSYKFLLKIISRRLVSRSFEVTCESQPFFLPVSCNNSMLNVVTC